MLFTTLWKLTKFSLTNHYKKIREITLADTKVFSQNFVRINGESKFSQISHRGFNTFDHCFLKYSQCEYLRNVFATQILREFTASKIIIFRYLSILELNSRDPKIVRQAQN